MILIIIINKIIKRQKNVYFVSELIFFNLIIFQDFNNVEKNRKTYIFLVN